MQLQIVMLLTILQLQLVTLVQQDMVLMALVVPHVKLKQVELQLVLLQVAI